MNLAVPSCTGGIPGVRSNHPISSEDPRSVLCARVIKLEHQNEYYKIRNQSTVKDFNRHYTRNDTLFMLTPSNKTVLLPPQRKKRKDRKRKKKEQKMISKKIFWNEKLKQLK